MARTRLGLWTEGSIVTLILTAFLLLVVLPLAAKGSSSKIPHAVIPPMPTPLFDDPIIQPQTVQKTIVQSPIVQSPIVQHSTIQKLMGKKPIVTGEEATPSQTFAPTFAPTFAMKQSAKLLQGTTSMKAVGIFFPPIGPTVISTPTKSSQIFGGNDSAAQVPAVVELKIETPPYEVFRSTVDAPMGQFFSIDPSYSKSQVKIHF